jgi:hypothetical protein
MFSGHESEIVDSSRRTGLFKRIVDGRPSYPVSPQPHKEIVAIAMLIQPSSKPRG